MSLTVHSKKCVKNKKDKNNVSIESMQHQNQKTQKQEKTQKTITKKKKINLSIVDKDKLWDIFDKDVIDVNDNIHENIEVIYDGKSESEAESGICKLCSSTLIIMEDGFPTCTNSSCGIIYKNTLDY